MRTGTKTLFVAMLFVAMPAAFLSCFLLAQTADPFLGAWRLNVEKSSYPKGACPKEMLIEMDQAGNAVHYRSTAVYENGAATRAEYTAAYDRRLATVTGASGLLLPVSLQRVSERTVIASYVRGLQVVATSRREVSADGLAMTITTTSPDSTGKNVTSVGVYERVRVGKK